MPVWNEAESGGRYKGMVEGAPLEQQFPKGNWLFSWALFPQVKLGLLSFLCLATCYWAPYIPNDEGESCDSLVRGQQ